MCNLDSDNVIYACLCENSSKHDGEFHELETDDHKLWHCPNCGKKWEQLPDKSWKLD